MPISSTRLKHFLGLYQVPYTFIKHPPAYSSQVAAATMHVPGKELAKTVILVGKTQAYVAVLPASSHVDLDKFAEIVGEPVSLAKEAKITDLFPDCELGAIPPFGRLYGLPVYVDVELAADEEIVFPAGTLSDAIRMRYEDFAGLARPEVASFAKAVRN
jgi:Ala-tRNA(Pro) deacylase